MGNGFGDDGAMGSRPRRGMTRRRMYLRMIAASFWNRRSRAVIASLSITVGAATLSGLGIVAVTVPDQLSRELRSYGANVVILPQVGSDLTARTVTDVDRVLAESTAEVLGRAPYSYGNLLYGLQPIQAMGTDLQAVAQVRPYWQVDGELPGRAGEILVGSTVAERYRWDVADRIGLTSSASAESDAAGHLTVTGILRTGGPEEEMIVLALEDLARFGVGSASFDVIEYSVIAERAELNTYAARINDAVAGVEAEVVRRIAEAETGIAETLQSLIWLVSVVICVLTLISISTTMQTVVAERAKEIGLKKALGARSREITDEFIGEAVLLGLVGGAIGLTAGIAIAALVLRQAFDMELSVDPWLVPATLVVSVLIAVAGSLIPARRIAAIQPITVLGGE